MILVFVWSPWSNAPRIIVLCVVVVWLVSWIERNARGGWVTSDDLRELQELAMSRGRQDAANHYFQMRRAWLYSLPIPFLRRWESNRPLLLHCVACGDWEEFRQHRVAMESGWVKREWTTRPFGPNGRSYRNRGWLHAECSDYWEAPTR